MSPQRTEEERKNQSDRQRRTAEEVTDAAREATLALNPVVGIRALDLVKAAGTVMGAVATQPDKLAKHWLNFAGEMVKVASNSSDKEPDPKDRRFADPAWKKNPGARALMQSYLAWQDAVGETVSSLELNEKDAARARLVSSIVTDAVAPSNNLFTNPTALKQLVDTGGMSAVEGFKNFMEDMTKNGGLPSSVDTSKFTVGENLANTPGNVVFKNEVVELIHYTADTEMVHPVPFVLVPPQINKYYSADLAPEKSMIRFLLSQGIQPYCVSWRNPTAKQRDWDFTTYIEALDEACAAAREITGQDHVNMMGSCSGGITLAAYLGWLAARDESERVKGVILAVCVLDTMAGSDNDFSALVTPETVMAAKMASQARGVLDGQDMAKMFAWMRPNDLIWNYWVNNYLLGNAPPAFDVLYWNADTTRLPAGLHADFLDMIFTNPFMHSGIMEVGGHAIDMDNVKHETMVIAGTTDHITPWKAVYETARIFGDETKFVLSNSGHLQSLLNPPGNPKAWYVRGDATAKHGEEWLQTAERQEGSWWIEWASFLKERSGAEVKAPKKPGSKKHPPIGPAPGTYIFEA
ncbi:alpha/beta fold hydrolase [Rhizobiaceae bacterium]|nr:alpha/beta fold hydrolase [Rhizobiaceae bacterium]